MNTCPCTVLAFPDTEDTKNIHHRPNIMCAFPTNNEPPILFTWQINFFILFLESEKCPKRSLPVFISPYPGDIFEGPTIFMNTEQLTRPVELKSILNARRKNVVEIWDYSLANVNILKEHGLHARHVPIVSPAWYIDVLRTFREPYLGAFPYEVGFCGGDSERRTKVFDKLKESGVSFYHVKEQHFEKDKELAKCAILINLHREEYHKIFECERCEPWLQLGVPVISEHSLDSDPRCINLTYDEIVQTVLYYLKKSTSIS